MIRYQSHYAMTENTSAIPETFNARFRDIDGRLHVQEELRGEIEALRNTLLANAAARIDDVIIPALERIHEIQSSGFLVAGIAENTAVAFVEGPVSIAIDAGLREIFRPTPFVALVRHDTADDWAVARTLEYNEATGVLALDIISVSGSAGPWEDVIVSATGGGAAGQIAFLEATRAARDAAIAAYDATVLAMQAAIVARDAAQDERLAAQGAREDSIAARNAAIVAKDAAEAAAALAQTFDPAAYYDKPTTDDLLGGKLNTSAAAGFATAVQGAKADTAMQVFAGSDVNALSLPVGHTLTVYVNVSTPNPAPVRNESRSLGLAVGSQGRYQTVYDNLPAPEDRLSGIWRCRGYASSGIYLFQRVS